MVAVDQFLRRGYNLEPEVTLPFTLFLEDETHTEDDESCTDSSTESSQDEYDVLATFSSLNTFVWNRNEDGVWNRKGNVLKH